MRGACRVPGEGSECGVGSALLAALTVRVLSRAPLWCEAPVLPSVLESAGSHAVLLVLLDGSAR